MRPARSSQVALLLSATWRIEQDPLASVSPELTTARSGPDIGLLLKLLAAGQGDQMTQDGDAEGRQVEPKLASKLVQLWLLKPGPTSLN
jgi:hypothetical protein